MKSKQVIRIFYTDFWEGCDITSGDIHQILSEKYEVIIDDKNPDYVIFSCFGDRHLQFDKAIKIFISGENIGADFNFADYAISSEYLEFGDRYFRLPLWCWSPPPPKHHLRQFYEEKVYDKKKFCNFIYSNNNHADPARRIFFELLSKNYKQVDSGGRYLNNIGEIVEDKIAWQRDYKFSIAFENSSQPGYATEKIVDALKANTIPIYWGDPCLAKELNPKRFINVHDFASFDAVIEEIKRLDEDIDAYIDMLAQPWFIGESSQYLFQNEAFKEWFFHIFEQDKEKARRITYFGFRAIILQQQREKVEATRKHRIRKKRIRGIIRRIERPFKRLRAQYYKLRKKAS